MKLTPYWVAPDDTFLMTFDHLRPDANADDFMTLRRDGRRVTALTVPPTYRLRPITTEGILEVQGRIEAVQREPRLTEARPAVSYRTHFPTGIPGFRETGGA